MRFATSSLLALSVILAACGGDKKAEAKADAKAEAKTDAKAGDEKAGDAKAGDEKAGDEKSEEEKKAEAEKQGRERLEKLAKAVEEEKARWTEEIEKAAADLAATDFADLESAMDKLLASPHRGPGNADRDEYRHAKETLAFFEVTPKSTVIEIGPGAGWYTELLAPLLAKNGKLIVTDYDINGPEFEYSTFNAKRLKAFLERSEATFGKVERVVNKDRKVLELGEPGRADVVLVIRGMHGWVGRDVVGQHLEAIHGALKPGGIFGVVQHRGKDDADPKEISDKGYLPEPWVIEQVEAAGFELVEKSDLNANPKDTKDHPEGVWNLPPTLTDGDKDKDKWLAIGESDRMTLKFKKK